MRFLFTFGAGQPLRAETDRLSRLSFDVRAGRSGTEIADDLELMAGEIAAYARYARETFTAASPPE